ncbi:carotenoid oxygenase [Aspergillus pseudoustus]|uniref:Carotenoid oxygenase n=1 Tax=Aspergillus pseudoustus TaxID=1810923 RepID=A0ABR4K9D9_9EURO
MPFAVNSDEVMKAGGDYWRFVPDQPSELLISPRTSDLPNHPGWKPGEFRKYTMPHGLVIRTGNAWEEEGGILKLESHFISFNLFYSFNPADYKGPQGPPSGDWKRWTVDLSKPDGTALPPPETLLSGIFDFPIFDERLTGRKSRVVYLGQMTKPESERPEFDAVVRLDTETGEKLIFSPSEDGRFAEPAYIPRGPDCEEGDGWLIFYTDRPSALKGELIILDTKDFTKPVAIAQLPFVLRNQVHGNWVPNPHPERSLPH